MAKTSRKIEPQHQEAHGQGEPAPIPEIDLLTEILARIDDGVSVQDRDLRIIYANSAHKKWFGDDIEGKFCYSVYERRPEVCPDCPVVECFKTGRAVRTVHEGSDQDGNHLAAEIVATPLRDREGEIIAGIEVVRIVTDQYKDQMELVAKTKRLERLAALSKDIASGLDLDRVLEQVVVNAAELVGAEGGMVALLDEENHRIIYPYTQGIPMDLSELSFPKGSGLIGHVMETREPLLLDGDSEYPACLELFSNVGPQAAIATPLVVGEKAVGTLALFSREEEKRFTPDDLDVVKAIADQAAVAIENARLFEETNERLRVRRELNKTAVSIASGLELDQVLKDVARHSAEIIKADAAMIALMDEDEGVISFPVAYNLPDELTALTIVPGKGLADSVIRSGSHRIINDYQSYHERRPEFAQAGVAAVATVPLKIGDRCVGAIGVMDMGSGQQFVREDIDILYIISRQAAVAVENARLYEELNRSAQKLEARVRERTEALSRMYEESENKSRELEEANAKLKEVDRLKSEFLANMSHELRTPLNSIIGFSKLILDGLDGSINEEQTRDLEIVHRNGQELLRLIDDLLDLAKIEAGRMRVSITREDPGEMLTEVALSLRTAADAKGLRLEYRYPDSLKAIEIDRCKTRQVLINLVANAIKFTDEGGITISVDQSPGETEFSVADTGKGLKPDQVEAVFDRFHQIKTDLADAEGVGLGLTLSKRFVELQGGRIWVESEYGTGSTFSFSLPNG